jgi:hypothetical protein
MSKTRIAEVREPSQAEIDALRMLRAIWREGDVRELRAFSVLERKGSDFRRSVVSGYFDNAEDMVAEAMRLDGLDAEAVYYTPNPVNPDLLARAVNRTKPGKKGAATLDEHVTRRCALLIDVDPVRPTDISSTDAEHAAARQRIWRITDTLEAQGWPLPIVVDSGNGWHAIYAIDMPNDADTLELVKGALAGLAAAHSDAVVGVDVSVCNASRIFKLPGTTARKGDSTPTRPHRLSSIQLMPETWELVTAEQLAALAPPKAEPAQRTRAASVTPATRAAQPDDADDVRLWIEEALGSISPDCSYGEWISVGVALKDVFGGEGLGYFDRWSSASAKYPGADEVAIKWDKLAASRHPGEEARTILGMASSGGFDMGAWRRAHNAAMRRVVASPQASAAVEVVEEVPTPDDALETTREDIEVSDGFRRWRFGQGRCVQVTPRGQDAESVEPFASDLWPRYHYASEDGHDHGVLYEYRAQRGDMRWGKMGAACFVSSGPGAKAAQEAGGVGGVRVHPGSDGLMALALGHWAEQRAGEHVTLVDRPGWHRHKSHWLYLQGQRVIGDAPWMADPTAPGLLFRDGKGGTEDNWRDGCAKLVTTAGLRVAIGVSLAGAMLARLGRQTFIVNFYGDSTAGKSTSLWLAASLWGNPVQLVRSWDATLNAMEGLALSASDACLCLDELQRFVEAGHEEELSRAVHALAGATGRARMSREAKLRDVASWKMCVLSSSESAIRDLVGRRYRGGDSVRALDVPVMMGELTIDAAHAEAVESWARRCYGHAGEMFARYLITKTDTEVHAAWQRWQVWLREQFSDASAEGGRVLDNIAVVGAAMELAREAGVHAWTQNEIADAVWWTALPVMRLREGADNPRQRQMTALLESLVATPACWPTEKGMRDAREVWGVLRPIGERLKQGEHPKEQQPTDQPDQREDKRQIDYDRYELWTQEGLLRRGPLKGHDVRSFLSWLAERGLGESVGNTRIRGVQGKWWKLNLEAISAALDDDQEATLPKFGEGS